MNPNPIPYDSHKPTAPFVGRDEPLEELLQGISNSKHFLLVGGRRMGKTAMLLRLGEMCREEGIPFHYMSLQEAPAVLDAWWMWGMVVGLVTGKGKADLAAHGADPYAAARFALKDWSADRPVVVAIDEADIMIQTKDSMTFFNNFRNFMGDSPWASHVLFVATAVHGLGWFKTQGSPLNYMSEVRLARLLPDDTRKLVALEYSFNEEVLERLERLCGGQPYLLQGTLERLWQKSAVGVSELESAANRHVESAPVFDGWWGRFTPRARAMYLAYASSDRALSWREAKDASKSAHGDAMDAQQTLSYHGVIEIGEDSAAKWCGALFKEWTVSLEGVDLPKEGVKMTTLRIEKPTKRPELPNSTQTRHGHWWLRSGSDTVVVFVYGIMSDSVACWHESPQQADAAYWPWLVASDDRLGYPNIYLGGYHSGIDAGCFGIENAADSLWTRLTTTSANGDPPVTSFKKIVFIAHSMGGLVVRQMHRANPPALAGKDIGLVLVASPSRGSRWSDAAGAEFGDIITHRQQQQLQYDNRFLTELNEAFRGLKDGVSAFNLSGIDLFEHHFLQKILRLFTVERPVKAEDSDAFFGKKCVIGGTDHMSIAKPANGDAEAHSTLVSYFEKKFRAAS